MTSVLNTEFQVRPVRGLNLPATLRPSSVQAARGSLALDLLLYDSVVLYLSDFSALVELALWLGEGAFKALQEQGVLTIAWGSSRAAHIPREPVERPERAKPGLNRTEVADGAGNRLDPERYVERALERWTNFGKRRRERFGRDALDMIDRVVGQEVITDAIAETRRDMQSEEIRVAFGLSGADDALLKAGDPEVHRLLRLNELNVGLRVAVEYPEADLHAEAALDRMVPEKLNIAARQGLLVENVARIASAKQLPDPLVFGKDRIAFARLIKLRQSDSGARFRQWVSEHLETPEEGDELLREYVAELTPDKKRKNIRMLLAGTGSAVATLVTSGMSGPASIVGSIAIGPAASFLVNALRGGWSVSAFLDDDLGSILDQADPENKDPLRLRSRDP